MESDKEKGFVLGLTNQKPCGTISKTQVSYDMLTVR